MRADGIHTATRADSGDLADLHRRSSLVYDDTREVLLARPDLFGVAPTALDAGHVRVVIREARIVAFATLVPQSDGTGELEDLFVDPVRMRRGLGRALVDDAVTRARSRGIGRIEVTANPGALAFYTAMGFVLRGRAVTEIGSGWRMSLEVPSSSAPSGHRPRRSS